VTPGGLTRRPALLQIAFSIGTLGLYGIYWFYVTAREMLAEQHEDIAPAGNWTLMAMLPLINLYAYWQFSRLFARVKGHERPPYIMMALWILVPPLLGLIVSPAGMAVVQRELNRVPRPDESAGA
jgi:cytochrome bd-type quinol oxidase subunit 2